MQLIHRPQRLLERNRAIGSVQIEDIDTVRAQLGQALIHALGQALGLVLAGLVRVAFRGEHEAAFLPFGVAREGFLLAADVGAGRVDFVVALRLEVVEDLGVFGRVGDAGAGGCIWAVGGSQCAVLYLGWLMDGERLARRSSIRG